MRRKVWKFLRDNRVMPQAHVWKHTGACSPSVTNCVTSLNHFTSCFIILSTLASYVSDLRGSRPRRINSICLPEHYCQLEDTMYSYEFYWKLLAAFVNNWVNSWDYDCKNSRANIHFSWYLTSDRLSMNIVSRGDYGMKHEHGIHFFDE